MGTAAEAHNAGAGIPKRARERENAKEADLVKEELERILQSSHFKNAGRCRQFLEYVVLHGLDGHPEQLKERTIGTEVFQRPPGYATGDDPVVRVQAGEVRRRLDQYYREVADSPAVRIVLPIGSYSPQFQWPTGESQARPAPQALPMPVASASVRHSKPLIFTAAALVFLLVAGLFVTRFHRQSAPQTVLDQFWAPVFATQQPVLICLAKPVVYRPTLELYRKYSAKHPGTFQTEVERYNEPLSLRPEETVQWGELTPIQNFGVAIGDVYAAVKVSALLGQLRKPSQVRIGSNYSFEDLANSPSVIVGAFNNRWTMQLTQDLHFRFVDENGQYQIRELVPGGRVWESTYNQTQSAGDDFAIVARLLDSKTGQFAIAAAGLSDNGTQAAGEFISNPKFLEKALAGADPNWPRKNMELVLKTSLTDAVTGPPQVVASYFW